MSRWRRYPKYKPSGVEWLGEVPEGWQLSRAKWLFKEIIDRNHPGEPLLSVTQHNSVVTREESDINVWNPTEDVSGYKLVKKGNFVISLRSFQGGIEHSSVQGIVSPAYIVLQKKNELCDNYFRFLFKSEPFISVLNISTTGIRQGKNIGYEDFSQIICPELTQKECICIAAFLDRETTRINSLILKKERQIELLHNKRASLIRHMVTKGLNLNVKMKDSGIEWIGAVPEHWELLRLKDACTIISGQSPSEETYNTDGIGAILVNGPAEYSENDFGLTRELKWTIDPKKWASKGVLLFCLRGSTTGRLNITHTKVSIGRGVAALIAKKNQYFLNYLMISIRDFILGTANGSTFPSVTNETLGIYPICQPPKKEQISISKFLDCEISQIDTIIDKIHGSIGLLCEYRSALISAAVTGKIDLRQEIFA
jgi:type I restriction enzyme, S subunit